MSIQFENTPITNLKFEGKVVKEVYFEDKLVYKLITEKVIFESDKPFSGEIELQEGIYNIIFIGAGAQRDSKYRGSFNGGGAGFIGQVIIPKGKYIIYLSDTDLAQKVGSTNNIRNASDSSIIISVGNGSAGKKTHAGAGGAAPVINTEIISETLNVAGNAGGSDTVIGGKSVYNGYGQGEHEGIQQATAGYLKLSYLGSK